MEEYDFILKTDSFFWAATFQYGTAHNIRIILIGTVFLFWSAIFFFVFYSSMVVVVCHNYSTLALSGVLMIKKIGTHTIYSSSPSSSSSFSISMAYILDSDVHTHTYILKYEIAANIKVFYSLWSAIVMECREITRIVTTKWQRRHGSVILFWILSSSSSSAASSHVHYIRHMG